MRFKDYRLKKLNKGQRISNYKRNIPDRIVLYKNHQFDVEVVKKFMFFDWETI